jgi:hypothetical protein
MTKTDCSPDERSDIRDNSRAVALGIKTLQSTLFVPVARRTSAAKPIFRSAAKRWVFTKGSTHPTGCGAGIPNEVSLVWFWKLKLEELIQYQFHRTSVVRDLIIRDPDGGTLVDELIS